MGEQGKQAHLSEDLRALRVPQDRSVVLSTGEKKIGILLTPRDGENTLVVTGEDLKEGEKETVSSSSSRRGARESELTLSGASEFLKSQTMMIGEASSSEAVITDMGCRGESIEASASLPS